MRLAETPVGPLDRSKEVSGSDPKAFDLASSDDTGFMHSTQNRKNLKAVARTTVEVLVNSTSLIVHQI